MTQGECHMIENPRGVLEDNKGEWRMQGNIHLSLQKLHTCSSKGPREKVDDPLLSWRMVT